MKTIAVTIHMMCRWLGKFWSWIGPRLDWVDVALVTILLGLATYSYWPDPVLAGNTWGDQDEKSFAALHGYQGKGFVDIFNGSKYPPRCSTGALLLMAMAHAVTGPYLGNAVYAVFVTGVATVLVLYFVGKKLTGRLTATIACLFLIVADQFRGTAMQIMTDIPAALFWMAAIWLLLDLEIEVEIQRA